MADRSLPPEDVRRALTRYLMAPGEPSMLARTGRVIAWLLACLSPADRAQVVTTYPWAAVAIEALDEHDEMRRRGQGEIA